MRFGSTAMVILLAVLTLIHNGVADSSIRFSAATDHNGSIHITFHFGNMLEQAVAYTLTVRKDFRRKPLLLCHWMFTDRTGQESACQPEEGYTSPGVQHHRLTLTIPKASGEDSGHYTLCVNINFEEEPTCKTSPLTVVEVNKGEADSSIQCSTATDVHGSANITFDLGNRLEQAETFSLIVRKGFKREPLLLCHRATTDRAGQENSCRPKEGYTSPGVQDHRLTLTILKASWMDSGDYTLCVNTNTEKKTICKTCMVLVVEVKKDTAYHASIPSSAIATAEPDMVVTIIFIIITAAAAIVVTVVLV